MQREAPAHPMKRAAPNSYLWENDRTITVLQPAHLLANIYTHTFLLWAYKGSSNMFKAEDASHSSWNILASPTSWLEARVMRPGQVEGWAAWPISTYLLPSAVTFLHPCLVFHGPNYLDIQKWKSASTFVPVSSVNVKCLLSEYMNVQGVYARRLRDRRSRHLWSLVGMLI